MREPPFRQFFNSLIFFLNDCNHRKMRIPRSCRFHHLSIWHNQSDLPFFFEDPELMAYSPPMRARHSTIRMKGCYILILTVAHWRKLEVGSLGTICIAEGGYAYVGSAMNGLDARLRRYLRPERARRWHIDHLLDCARLLDIVVASCEKSVECEVSRSLMLEWPVVPGFGSSDCRCLGHLFGPAPLKSLRSSAYRALSHCGLKPQI